MLRYGQATLSIAGAALLTVAFAQSAHANANSLLRVGDGGSCASGYGGTGCPFLYSSGSGTPTEVGAINTGTNPGSFDLYYSASNAKTFDDPVLAIVGVPNTGSGNATNYGLAPSLTSASLNKGSESVTIANGIASGAATFGNISTNGAGLFTSSPFSSSSGGDVYSFLRLAGTANKSNSFANWSAADQKISGISATSFSIYVFSFTPSGAAFSNDNNLLTVGFDQMAVGTFVVAYGEDTGETYSATPFTQAGYATSSVTPNTIGGNTNDVPEPGSAALLVAGLPGLLLVRGRRQHRA